MADVRVDGGNTPSLFLPRRADRLRPAILLSYLLYLGIVTMPLGAVLAYVKWNDARGTAYESHLANAIDVFWVSMVVGFASVPLIWLFGLGAVIEAALLVWLISRIVKGLGGAVEARPYERLS